MRPDDLMIIFDLVFFSNHDNDDDDDYDFQTQFSHHHGGGGHPFFHNCQ